MGQRGRNGGYSGATGWQRAIHVAAFVRSAAISSNVRPSPSSLACFPLSVCSRCTMTSTYFGSSSTPATDALRQFSRRECAPAPQETVINQLAPLRVVQDRAPYQIDRLLCWVIELLLVGAAHNKLGTRPIPNRRRARSPTRCCTKPCGAPAGTKDSGASGLTRVNQKVVGSRSTWRAKPFRFEALPAFG